MFVSTCAVSAFANLQVRGTEVEPCEVTTKTGLFFFVFFAVQPCQQPLKHALLSALKLNIFPRDRVGLYEYTASCFNLPISPSLHSSAPLV